MTDEEMAFLREAYLAGVEAHKSHRPRLYRGADGMYRCTECYPPGVVRAVAWWWERAVDAVRERRRR